MPSSPLVLKTEYDTVDVGGLLSKLTGIEDWQGSELRQSGPMGTRASYGAEVVVPGELARSTTERYTAHIELSDGYAAVYAFKADKHGFEPGPPDEVNWSIELDLAEDLADSPYASFFSAPTPKLDADASDEPRMAAGPGH